MDSKEDILEQLKQGLRSYQSEQHSGWTDDVSYNFSSDDIATVDLNNVPTISLTGGTTFNWPNASPNVYITNTGTTVWDDLTINGTNAGGKISLQGDDADIEINGQSLMKTIQGIADRLNILCPDPDMESEWNELREIREKYDAKLAECREKSRAWKALKQSG